MSLAAAMLVTGLVATAVADAWQWLAHRIFGIASSDWRVVGRWVLGFRRGRFYNPSVGRDPALKGEMPIGWGFHYVIGAVYAATYWLVLRLGEWDPSPLNALAFGFATVVAPLLVMKPAMGAGICASRTPNRLEALFLTFSTHLAFGLGLFLGATPALLAAPGAATSAPLVAHTATPQAVHLVPMIGGVRQDLLVRGKAGAPILVIVHGGPGADENPLFRHYTPGLERHFQVVYWQQRGTGRSFSDRIPPSSMTIARFVSDLSDVVRVVTDRFGNGKVFLLAHSWGTIPAALYAQAHPEHVAAYIAIGQIVDAEYAETTGWEWALKEARDRKNRRAVRALEHIGPPPHDVDEMLTSRKWVEAFGGAFHGRMRTRDLILAALKDEHTNLKDLYLFGRGNAFSLETLWPEIRHFRLEGEDRWATPVVFLTGAHDRITPPDAVRSYYERVQSRCKRNLVFDQSAHNLPFEEPDRFVAVLTSELVPWAVACSSGS